MVTTTYRDRMQADYAKDATTYRFSLEDPSGQPIFSRTFKCFPNDAGDSRIIEEQDGQRFFHGLVPRSNVEGTVTNLWRQSSVGFFLDLCERMSPEANSDGAK